MAKQTRAKIAKEHLRTKSTIDKLCAAALTRHANMSAKDFLKEIGRANDPNPKQAIRESLLNLSIACLEELLTINRTLELMLANDEFVKKGEVNNG